MMDSTDRLILAVLQQKIPVTTHPFDRLAKNVGVDPGDLLLRIHKLKEDGVIRYINGIFDKRKLGYRQTLLGISVDDDKLLKKAADIHKHPAVRESFETNGRINFWVNLELPTDISVDVTAKKLAEHLEARRCYILPVLRRFTSMGAQELMLDQVKLSKAGFTAVRLLQQDLPLSDHPFKELAEQVGWSEGQLFEEIRLLRKAGVLLEFRASLFKREDKGNCFLVVWKIPEERRARVAAELAARTEFVECVERPAYPGFSFSLYSRVFCESLDDCEEVLRGLERKIGLWPKAVYPMKKRFRKDYFQLFDNALVTWKQETNPV